MRAVFQYSFQSRIIHYIYLPCLFNLLEQLLSCSLTVIRLPFWKGTNQLHRRMAIGLALSDASLRLYSGTALGTEMRPK